jgi:rhomboid protease GluP
MTLDLIVIQIVAISCIAILIRSTKNQGWSLVAAGILGLLTFGIVTKAPWTAWVCGSLWFVGVLLPVQGMAQIARLRSQEKYHQAQWIAQVVRILHPGDGWWSYPKTLKALELSKQGHLDRALAVLKPMQSIHTYDGRLAIATTYGLQAQWQSYLDFAETQLTPAMRLEETSSAGMYLRSLGETRQINELLHAVKDIHIRTRKTGNTALLLIAKLYAFAFSGQVEDVRTLLKTHLTAYSPQLQRFWISTAQWYAGNFEVAMQEFQDLAMHTHNCELRNSLKARSHQSPLRSFELLTLDSRQILAQLQETQQQDTQYNPRTAVTRQQAPLTYGIMAINVLIYLAPFITLLLFVKLDLSFPPALENTLASIVTIYQWGALVPNQFFAGAWWQPLTAMFMHDPSGIVHIVLNMLGLAIVGAFVESRLGTIKFAIAYFISGLGSMVILALLSRMIGAGTMSAIGASGAIMGMVGVMGVIYWTGWRRGEQAAKQWLRSIVLIIGLQTVFDLLNPNVSMTGHMAGLVIGAIVGLLLVPTQTKSPTTRNLS